MSEITIIGRAEKMDLLDLGISHLPVKTDTGADTSSIWASKVEKSGRDLHVVFLGPESAFFTGEVHVFPHSQYTMTRIANSFGHKEVRYKVKLKVKLKGKLINASFSLADRSTKLYPALIGRSLLNKKFLVDVSIGSPLLKEEKKRAKVLKKILSDAEGDI